MNVMTMGRQTVAVGALCALMGWGCSDPVVMYRGETLQAVDMHLHTGEWSLIPPSTQQYLAERFPFPLNLNPGKLAESSLSAEGVVQQLDGAGFDSGVLLAIYAPHSVGIATNELVLEEISKAPDRLYGLASLRVDRWSTDSEAELSALRAALSHDSMIGIKLAHAHQHFRMDDPDYYGIYELAEELGAPLYLHTGPSPFPGTMSAAPYTDALYLEEAIAAHPDAIFILGHVGYDFIQKDLGTLETCLRLAETYDNVYLEPSALGSVGSDPTGENYREVFRRVREEGLVDRLIYGSDGPQFPGFLASYTERTIQAMTAAEYTLSEAQLVFSENFSRVFGVEL
jgi:predicted TIM-barrel fold metal-dependent hydrolase